MDLVASRSGFLLVRKFRVDHPLSMPEPDRLITRRSMLARSAATVATLSLPAWLSGKEPVKGRRIAITIDDGPATGVAGDLEAFLRIANAIRASFVAEKVPAILFVNEDQLHVDGQRDARVDVLNQWLDAGLDLGNHTYSHPNLNNVTLTHYLDDIVKGEVISRSLLDVRKRTLDWFRYPFLAAGSGETAKTVEEFLAARNYRIAPVSVDYADYRFAGGYSGHLRVGNRPKADEQFATMLQMLDAAFDRAESRSVDVLGYELPQILLIHCNEMNALTLPLTIQRIRERGYTFVSLDEAMQDPAYHLQGMAPGSFGGGGLFDSLAAAKRGTNLPR